MKSKQNCQWRSVHCMRRVIDNSDQEGGGLTFLSEMSVLNQAIF